MKRLRQYFSIFTLLLLLTSVVSCSTDGYSLDKFGIAWATVNEPGVSYTFDVKDPKGLTAYVVSDRTNSKPKNKRVILDYTPVGDNYQGYDLAIIINDYIDVLTKDIMYAANDNEVAQDTLGISPIDIVAISEGGGYLNMQFKVNTSHGGRHLLNMVSADPDLGVGENEVKLKFRHRADGVNKDTYFGSWGYLSLNLAPYRIQGRDKVTFIIENEYPIGGKKEFKVEYSYKVEEQPEEGEKPNIEEKV